MMKRSIEQSSAIKTTPKEDQCAFKNAIEWSYEEGGRNNKTSLCLNYHMSILPNQHT